MVVQSLYLQKGGNILGKYKLNDDEKIKKAKEQFSKSTKKAKEVSGQFKKFAFKGNIFELATGVIIGNAFTKIVNSLVNEIIMPSLGIITNKVDFNSWFVALDGNTYATVEEAKAAGASVINAGAFVTNIIDFFIIAIVVFIFMQLISKTKKKQVVQEAKAEEVTTKSCPYCFSTININATRCPNCTSSLNETPLSE